MGKQQRKGKKISQKLANLEAISQSAEDLEISLFREGPIILCSGCESEITSADYEAGKCTQCGTPVWK